MWILPITEFLQLSYIVETWTTIFFVVITAFLYCGLNVFWFNFFETGLVLIQFYSVLGYDNEIYINKMEFGVKNFKSNLQS